MLNTMAHKIFHKNRSDTIDQRIQLSTLNTFLNSAMPEHIYEEIADENSAKCSQENVYLDVLNETTNTKKSVRFTAPQPKVKYHYSETNNVKCILKKKPVPLSMLQISPGSCEGQQHECCSPSSDSTSSFSSQIYTNSSIGSNTSSLNSTHSVAFNNMVDSFLNRFKTLPANSKPKKKSNKSDSLKKELNSSISSSSSSISTSSLSPNTTDTDSTKKQTCGCSCNCAKLSNSHGNVNNHGIDNRLSFRVTNLSIEDLKLRQKMICQTTAQFRKQHAMSQDFSVAPCLHV